MNDHEESKPGLAIKSKIPEALDHGFRVEHGYGKDTQTATLYSDGVIALNGKRGYENFETVPDHSELPTRELAHPEKTIKPLATKQNQWEWYRIYDKDSKQVGWVRIVSSFAEQGYRIPDNFSAKSYRPDGTKEFEVSKTFDLRGKCASTSYTSYKADGISFDMRVIRYEEGLIFTHGIDFKNNEDIVQIFDDRGHSTTYNLEEKRPEADKLIKASLSKIPSILFDLLNG